MYPKPSPILFPIPRKRCLSLPKVIGTHDSTSCSFLWDLHPQLSSLQIFSSHSFHSSDMPISSPPILSWLLYGVVSLRCLLALWVLSVGSGVRQPWVGAFILILVLSHIAWVTLGQLFNFSKSSFLAHKMEITIVPRSSFFVFFLFNGDIHWGSRVHGPDSCGHTCFQTPSQFSSHHLMTAVTSLSWAAKIENKIGLDHGVTWAPIKAFALDTIGDTLPQRKKDSLLAQPNGRDTCPEPFHMWDLPLASASLAWHQRRSLISLSLIFT